MTVVFQLCSMNLFNMFDYLICFTVTMQTTNLILVCDFSTEAALLKHTIQERVVCINVQVTT